MSTTRRQFIASASTAAAAPFILPGSRAMGEERSTLRTIRLGHIGTGGRGGALLRNFTSAPGARSVAVCDPFEDRRASASAHIKETQGHTPKSYADFRELLADPRIDAVVIATPDHWHTEIGIAAVAAGKDVYLEKPLGYTLAQNQEMLAACESSGRFFQYGTQQRSQEIIHRGMELVLNGTIGDIERIEMWCPEGKGGGSLDEIPVPGGLDYNLFIGPAPMRPPTKDRLTMEASWYCADYAIGFIAGWGAHPLDIAIWGQNYDLQGLYKIKGTGHVATPDALFNTITSWDVQMEFAGGIHARFMSRDLAEPVVRAYCGETFRGDGTTFFGSKGWISLSRSGASASNPEWLRQRIPPESARLPYLRNWYHAFVECVRERKPSPGTIQEAVRSDAMSHLSAIAIESGQEITWDPNAYRIVSHNPLNEKMTTPTRDWQNT